MASVVQSAVFNLWLGRRVVDGHLHGALEGDILRKRETGGLFLCEDVATDADRAARGEVDATGPMIGPRMKSAAGEALAREQQILTELGVTPALLEALGR